MKGLFTFDGDRFFFVNSAQKRGKLHVSEHEPVISSLFWLDAQTKPKGLLLSMLQICSGKNSRAAHHSCHLLNTSANYAAGLVDGRATLLYDLISELLFDTKSRETLLSP